MSKVYVSVSCLLQQAVGKKKLRLRASRRSRTRTYVAHDQVAHDQVADQRAPRRGAQEEVLLDEETDRLSKNSDRFSLVLAQSSSSACIANARARRRSIPANGSTTCGPLRELCGELCQLSVRQHTCARGDACMRQPKSPLLEDRMVSKAFEASFVKTNDYALHGPPLSNVVVFAHAAASSDCCVNAQTSTGP